jgi:hypothetical protein
MTPIHQEPPDAIIHLAPKAMLRLIELREKQQTPLSKNDDQNNNTSYLILRMGVRNG